MTISPVLQLILLLAAADIFLQLCLGVLFYREGTTQSRLLSASFFTTAAISATVSFYEANPAWQYAPVILLFQLAAKFGRVLAVGALFLFISRLAKRNKE